jgi:cytochrome c-type biogenesis protein CcmH/NrfG
MLPHSTDLSTCSALVVEGNPTMRSIMRAQLRDLGINNVVQVSRAEDARKALEYRSFDFVLCELQFQGEPYSGQDLLDDLRRNQLLPFSTVFIIVTAEASYQLVSEAAESALDSFLLKPYAPTQLSKRLIQSRSRKNALKDIFLAMEEQRFEVAAQLCVRRFEAREKYWLFSARLGAELLLRIGRFNEAQAMFKAIVSAKTLPWAKLGVARAQLEGAQVSQATNTLEQLLNEEPQFADAYDVMGRAHFEQGKFSAALETYTMAANLTPHSLGRLQNLAMVTFYAGSHEDAEPLLERTVRTGLDSKIFDAQVLVLLAFARFERNDRQGLLRCRDDLLRLIEKDPDKPRLQRLNIVIGTLCHIVLGQFSQCVTAIREQCGDISDSEFDFESASNLLTLLCQLTHKAIVLDEIDKVVETIGMRFCSSRAQTELMHANAQAHPPFAEQMRQSQSKVVQFSEAALRMSLSGKPAEAVQELLRRGRETCNARLIDNAHQVLQKHAQKIPDAEALEQQVQQLRTQYGVNSARPSLSTQGGRASGLALDHYGKASAPARSLIPP